MARAATTTDAFNAIAEPRRRQIIQMLAIDGEQAVGVLVERLGLAQPAVSKHLAVLRKVGLVVVVRQGQHRLYRFEAAKLKPVHEWVKGFERFWSDQLDAIKSAAERKARERAAHHNNPLNKEKR
ncbi:MAG TPA: metalloregulator ArsR/SmtB family transcription factor [Humisphaera sp.]|jgi:DNA-binding transcriptional ArsR family regulator|nr:metalloregulator ArsR/SmtB family transcription factor [Humisphaera sp.]